MKCISCGTDNNLKDRTANLGQCKSCHHPFAFEPTAMPAATKLTDPFFAKLLIDLSTNNTLFFTPRQLYYLLDRRLRWRTSKNGLLGNMIGHLGCTPVVALFISAWIAGFFRWPFSTIAQIVFSIYAALTVWSLSKSSFSRQTNRRGRQNSIKTLQGFAAIALSIGLFVSIMNQWWGGAAVSLSAGIGALWLSSKSQRQQQQIFDEFSIERGQFDIWLNQWTSINGSPDRLLPEPEIASLPAAPNPEVTAYSFDRVVVCDRPEVAQLLIRNNFHFEHNCAILTIDGYPHSIFETTMTMLRRNPDLQVYALHDCSPHGVQLVSRLRQSDAWFPTAAIPIIDVGIMPRQILTDLDATTRQSARAAQAARSLPAAVRASLTAEELQWLDAGCYLDLESFSPHKLMRILQRAISTNRDLGGIDAGDMAIGDDYSAGGGFYALENFG